MSTARNESGVLIYPWDSSPLKNLSFLESIISKKSGTSTVLAIYCIRQKKDGGDGKSIYLGELGRDHA